MYYTLNKNNKITAAANYKFQPDAVYTDEEVVYDYNGQLVFKHETESEEYKAAASVHEKLKRKEDLRFRRETECFMVINRGYLWYDTLTAAQRDELKMWYEAWLNITKTLIVPVKPEWLK